jgi:hypothetical protein
MGSLRVISFPFFVLLPLERGAGKWHAFLSLSFAARSLLLVRGAERRCRPQDGGGGSANAETNHEKRQRMKHEMTENSHVGS